MLDELRYDGWVGCEYKPANGTAAGLNWLYRLMDRPVHAGTPGDVSVATNHGKAGRRSREHAPARGLPNSLIFDQIST